MVEDPDFVVEFVLVGAHRFHKGVCGARIGCEDVLALHGYPFGAVTGVEDIDEEFDVVPFQEKFGKDRLSGEGAVAAGEAAVAGEIACPC